MGVDYLRKRQELSKNTKSFYTESFNIGMFDFPPLKKINSLVYNKLSSFLKKTFEEKFLNCERVFKDDDGRIISYIPFLR